MPNHARSLAEAPQIPIIVPAVLIAAAGCSILSTDLYAPSLPHLPRYFGVDAETVQLSMSLNLLALAAAQLVHGPLADRFGRRPVLLVGMGVFALASLGCAMAGSVGALIGFRMLQGASAASQAVVVSVVIRELYPGVRAARVMAIYGMTIAIAPAIGPMLGGHIHVWFGWQANFVLLAALIAIVTAALGRVVPETVPAERIALRPAQLLRRYAGLVRNRGYRGYVLVATFNSAGLFGFITAAPFVLIDHMGVATEHFGYYQAVSVAFFALGSLVANRLIGRISLETVLRAGLGLLLLGGLTMALLRGLAQESPLSVVLAMSVYVFGMAMAFAVTPMRAFDCVRDGRGQASALSGASQMGGASIGAWVSSQFHDGTVLPLAVALLGASLCANLIYFIGRPWREVQG